jgi:transposase
VWTIAVFVLISGCAWRHLSPSFGVAVPTAHRRFAEWAKAGLWRKLHRAVLDELGSQAWSTGPERPLMVRLSGRKVSIHGSG